MNELWSLVSHSLLCLIYLCTTGILLTNHLLLLLLDNENVGHEFLLSLFNIPLRTLHIGNIELCFASFLIAATFSRFV